MEVLQQLLHHKGKYSCISLQLGQDNRHIWSIIVLIISVVVELVNTPSHQRAATTTDPTCELHLY